MIRTKTGLTERLNHLAGISVARVIGRHSGPRVARGPYRPFAAALLGRDGTSAVEFAVAPPILLGLPVPVADPGMALARRQQAGAQSQHLQWAAVIMVGTNRLRCCLSGNYTVARAILTRLEAAIISAMTPVTG